MSIFEQTMQEIVALLDAEIGMTLQQQREAFIKLGALRARADIQAASERKRPTPSLFATPPSLLHRMQPQRHSAAQRAAERVCEPEEDDDIIVIDATYTIS